MTFLAPALLFALPLALLPVVISSRRVRRQVTLTFLATFVFTTIGCTSMPWHRLNGERTESLCWPHRPFTKVMGYSYKASEISDGFGSGLVAKNGINLGMLQKITASKSKLSKDQVGQLIGAVQKSEEMFPEMMCYEPHHVFVFYSDKNEAVAAIEVCFTCNGIRTWPDAKIVRTLHGIRCDFPALARLADELGLGLGSPKMTLPKYLRKLKQQQEENAGFLKKFAETRP